MIIGHGDISSVLPDRDDLLFFASGVSNSRETRESEYQREIDLFLRQDRSAHLVYFSSLSIFYSNTRYTLHKEMMEGRVRQYFSGDHRRYTILRLGNIIWGSNPHTLINFIRNRIRNRQTVEVKDVYRYVIEKEEFLHWIDMIPPWSCEMNIPGRRMKVIDIIKEYCYPWGSIEDIIRGANGPSEYDYSKQELQVCV